MNRIILNGASRKQQSGVILVLALVILLVLTLLIVSSMNSTNTQVLMTGNSQYHTLALNDAENALRFAETSIAKFSVNANAKPEIGYYDVSTNNNIAIDFSNFSWDTSTAAVYNSNSRRSLYVIEYTGRVPLPGASIAITQNENIAGDETYLYRITARSQSARGAVRYVQSVYKAAAAPL